MHSILYIVLQWGAPAQLKEFWRFGKDYMTSRWNMKQIWLGRYWLHTGVIYRTHNPVLCSSLAFNGKCYLLKPETNLQLRNYSSDKTSNLRVPSEVCHIWLLLQLRKSIISNTKYQKKPDRRAVFWDLFQWRVRNKLCKWYYNSCGWGIKKNQNK